MWEGIMAEVERVEVFADVVGKTRGAKGEVCCSPPVE